MRPDGHGGAEHRRRWGLLALVAGLHVLALIGLIHAFAPNFSASVAQRASALITVNITPPLPPEPVPSPDPSPKREEGAASEAGKRATPKEATAPEPRIVLPIPSPVPIVASTGLANSFGAREEGVGTGAGGAGEGTGSGRGGNGQGGVPVTRPVKIAGAITNSDLLDFPIPPGGRQTRFGQSVTVNYTVGVGGKVSDCRIVEPSNDPVADKLVCELIVRRFRYRPATDANGNAVSAVTGWQQRFCRGSCD